MSPSTETEEEIFPCCKEEAPSSEITRPTPFHAKLEKIEGNYLEQLLLNKEIAKEYADSTALADKYAQTEIYKSFQKRCKEDAIKYKKDLCRSQRIRLS